MEGSRRDCYRDNSHDKWSLALHVCTCIWSMKWFVPHRLNLNKYKNWKAGEQTNLHLHICGKYLNFGWWWGLLGEKWCPEQLLFPLLPFRQAHCFPVYPEVITGVLLSILFMSANFSALRKGDLQLRTAPWFFGACSLHCVYTIQWSVDHRPLAFNSLGSLPKCSFLVPIQNLWLWICAWNYLFISVLVSVLFTAISPAVRKVRWT